MDVAIVYESLFGNTRAVAEAIAEGVREADPAGHVTLVRVVNAKAGDIQRAALLVVGGPTHMRGMTSGSTRQRGLAREGMSASGKGRHFVPEPGAQGPGVRDWFGALPRARPGARAAAFDTRGDYRLAGGAARKICRRLRRHGYDLIGKPEGFVVEGMDGPLHPGEREKARAWGAWLICELYAEQAG